MGLASTFNVSSQGCGWRRRRDPLCRHRDTRKPCCDSSSSSSVPNSLIVTAASAALLVAPELRQRY